MLIIAAAADNIENAQGQPVPEVPLASVLAEYHPSAHDTVTAWARSPGFDGVVFFKGRDMKGAMPFGPGCRDKSPASLAAARFDGMSAVMWATSRPKLIKGLTQ